MKNQNEKQAIEEMAAFLWKNTLIHTEDLCHDVAETVIKEGYRKQSVGEWKWIADDSPMCNICGNVFDTDDNADAGTGLWKFCPNCGARMKGGEE